MKKRYASAKALIDEILQKEGDPSDIWNIIDGHWYNYAFELRYPFKAIIYGEKATVLGLSEYQNWADIGYESEEEIQKPYIIVDVTSDGEEFCVSMEDLEDVGGGEFNQLFVQAWKEFLETYYLC